MWILEWGDATNQVSGQWNHEEHDNSEKALEAAKTKTGMKLIAHAIYSPPGALWMSGKELQNAIKTDGAASEV